MSERCAGRRFALSATCVVALAACAWMPVGASADPPASVPPVAPSADPFYTPPPGYQTTAPGTILRSRSVPLTPGSGVMLTGASAAYQLLYRTADANGDPIATVATFLSPAVPATGARKLVAYQDAEDSLTTNCAPSYTLQSTGPSTDSTIVAALLAQGWDVVVPDHEGPLSQWAVGPLEGRTTLDSIRAVERFSPAALAGTSTRVGMTGYSGGALATTWANALAPSYAPQLNLVAVTAGGIPADLAYSADHIDGSPFFGGAIGVFVGVNRAYPFGLDSLLNANGKALARADGMDQYGCSGSVVNAPLANASQYTNYPSMPAFMALPQVKAVFDKLSLVGGPAPTAPSFYYNAVNDELAFIAPVDQMVAGYCAQGATIDYYRDPATEHLSGPAVFLPLALSYIENRFAGQPPPNTCPPGGG